MLIKHLYLTAIINNGWRQAILSSQICFFSTGKSTRKQSSSPEKWLDFFRQGLMDLRICDALHDSSKLAATYWHLSSCYSYVMLMIHAFFWLHSKTLIHLPILPNQVWICVNQVTTQISVIQAYETQKMWSPHALRLDEVHMWLRCQSSHCSSSEW